MAVVFAYAKPMALMNAISGGGCSLVSTVIFIQVWVFLKERTFSI